MSENKDIVISAQVLLQPASGNDIDLNVGITADNLSEFVPSPATIAKASEVFRRNGFEVGPMVGVSFSVTGALRIFEKFFGVSIRMGSKGAYEFVSKNKSLGREIRTVDLPEELRNSLSSVVFPLPVDFGPTNF